MNFEQTLMLGHNLLVCTKWSKLTLIWQVQTEFCSSK